MVLDIPPISPLFSSMMGIISVLFSNSYAAVSPAGPAPIMTALFFMISIVYTLSSGTVCKIDRLKRSIGTITRSIGILFNLFFSPRRKFAQPDIPRQHKIPSYLVNAAIRNRITRNRPRCRCILIQEIITLQRNIDGLILHEPAFQGRIDSHRIITDRAAVTTVIGLADIIRHDIMPQKII